MTRSSALRTFGLIGLVKNWVYELNHEEHFEVIFGNLEDFGNSVRSAGSKTFVSTLAGTTRQVLQADFSKLNNRFLNPRCKFDHGN
jgi:hypothetical protein